MIIYKHVKIINSFLLFFFVFVVVVSSCCDDTILVGYWPTESVENCRLQRVYIYGVYARIYIVRETRSFRSIICIEIYNIYIHIDEFLLLLFLL